MIVLLLTSWVNAGEISPAWKRAETRLRNHGFNSKFIKALKKAYEPREFQDTLELNILLFLRKVDFHGIQVTNSAVNEVNDFILANKNDLRTVERKFGVSGATIASLLWLESRFGKNSGNFHVASVYLHLIQSERPEILKHLRKVGPKRFAENPAPKDLKKIPLRAKTKSKWAMKELKAIEKIFLKRGKIALELRGSFSGAFGMPQFLPSSYATWAKSKTAKGSPNLNLPSDAIYSVANYLQQNGWRKNRPKTHSAALFHYNNSRDYGDAVLALSQKVDFDPSAQMD